MNPKLNHLERGRIYVVCGAILIALVLGILLGKSRELFFDVRMCSSTDDIAQVFFDTGRSYNEQDSSTVGITAGPVARVYRFRLAAKQINSLRFDVLTHEGQVTILNGTIVDDQGNVLRTFTADDFGPHVHLRTVERSKSQVTLATVRPPPGQVLDPSAYVLNSAVNPKLGISLRRAMFWSLFFVALFSLSVVAFRWLKNYPYLSDQRVCFRAAVSVVIAATFIHLMSLPLVVSYDGMDYARLANVLFSPSFIADWRFLRTPLFPLSLKFSFWLGGEQPQSALLVTTLFGLGGTLLVGATVRRIAGGLTGAVALLLLVFYPVLVGYQHMLLSETGTFFWLALLIWSLVRCGSASSRASIWLACWIALVLTLGYYWRPTIQYLSPLVALTYLMVFSSLNTSTSRLDITDKLRRRSPRLLGGALIVAVGPWLLASPWIYLTEKYAPGIMEGTIVAGMFKQVLVPPEDSVFGPLRDQYVAVLKQDSTNGSLPLDGISIAARLPLMEQIGVAFHRVGLIQLIGKYPRRYFRGVIKSMVFFLGVPEHGADDENWNFSHEVFGLWAPNESLDGALGWDRNIVQFRSTPYNGGASVGKLLNGLLPYYTWLLLVSSAASVGLLVFSVKRTSAVAFAITAIPLAFLFLHALTLMAVDRYGFPAYPLLLANLITAISVARQTLWRRLSRTITTRTYSTDSSKVPTARPQA